MTMRSELIRQNELLNQLVLDRNTLEELGRVEVLWMYPQSHRVLGFICKSGLLGGQKSAFHLGQLEALGASGVLVQGRPDKTTADRVRRLESLIDHEIWSDEGSRVGRIIDCLFDLRSGEITAYLFTSSGWGGLVGELYELPPYQILSFGKQRVLVSESARFELYQAGLSQKLEATTEQAKEQIQQLTEQARTRAQRLSQRLGQKTQGFLEQAKEKTQVILEQAKETTQLMGEQVESGLETLTTQAEEAFGSLSDEFLRRSETGRDPDQDRNVEFDDFDQAFDFDEPEREQPAFNRSAPAPSSQPAPASRPNTAASPGRSEPDANPWGDVSDLDAPIRSAISIPAPSGDLDDWDDWDDVWGDDPGDDPAASTSVHLSQPSEQLQDWEDSWEDSTPASQSSEIRPDDNLLPEQHPEASYPEVGLEVASVPDHTEVDAAELHHPEPKLPEIEQPAVEQPEVEQPEIEQPAVEQPEAVQLKASQPKPDLPGVDPSQIAWPELHLELQASEQLFPEVDRPEIQSPVSSPPPNRPIVDLPRSPELNRPIVDLPPANAAELPKPPPPKPDLPVDPDPLDDEPWI